MLNIKVFLCGLYLCIEGTQAQTGRLPTCVPYIHYLQATGKQKDKQWSGTDTIRSHILPKNQKGNN